MNKIRIDLVGGARISKCAIAFGCLPGKAQLFVFHHEGIFNFALFVFSLKALFAIIVGPK